MKFIPAEINLPVIHWYISTHCQLRCFFCRAIKDEPSLQMNECEKIVENIANSGVRVVIFTGGEPLYNQREATKVINLIETCKKRGLYTALDTNGIELIRNPELIGQIEGILDRIGLPLDGPSPEIHDEFRGMVGHFDMINKLLHHLEFSKIRIKINTVVTKRNKDEVFQIGEILKNRRISLWSLHQLSPTGRGRMYRELHHIRKQEFDQIIKGVLQKYSEIKLEGVSHSTRKGTYLVIRSSGDVSIIPSNSRGKYVCLGNALETSISELWQSLLIDKEKIQKRYQLQLQLLRGEIEA